MRIYENADLKKYCTFGIGGKATFLIDWQGQDELPEIINIARTKGLPIFVFGGGSNLLFPDNNLDALIIRCQLKAIELVDNSKIVCEAGSNWATIKTICAKAHLFGLESFYGLPGTIGGAVYGNAGCHGQEIKDLLISVKYFDLDSGSFNEYLANKADFSYRDSLFKRHPRWIITTATLKVSNEASAQTGDPNEFADFRNKNQPKGLTTGSFFKNPRPDYAGELLEKAGFKGYRQGNVGFSDQHANFVVNYGNGTAKEVLELTNAAIKSVETEFHKKMESEVRIVKETDLIWL